MQSELRRVRRELKQARLRERVSAELLRSIVASSGDAKDALQKIAEATARFFKAPSVTIRIAEDNEWVQDVRFGAGSLRTGAHPAAKLIERGASLPATVFQENRQIHIPDLDNIDPSMAHWPVAAARADGIRTTAGTPLRRDGQAIGVLIIYRDSRSPFTEDELALQQTFADQAVIAIENARLINEVQARTRDLEETLAHQRATNEVLNVIGRSPVDAGPVFKAIVESAARLCNGVFANVRLYDGHQLRVGATYNFTPGVLERFLAEHPKAPDRRDLAGRCILERRPVHVPDVLADPDYGHEMALAGNWRSVLSVPMLRDGMPIGMVAVSRSEPKPFSDREIGLLTTFAEQAVIAIRNVGLFEEVESKSRDLQEALRQQTATADVLKVISRSAFDLQAVLDTLTESAARLCGAESAALVRQAGDGSYYHATRFNFPAEWDRVSRAIRLRPERGSLVGRVLLARGVVQIADVLADPEYAYPEQQSAGRYRTLLGVPLLRSGEPIGVLFLGRTTVAPFSEQQIELVQTFADQAVIAIENARLFDEVQARTRDVEEALGYQTATSEVLNVISRSPNDMQPVMDTIAETAQRLCGSEYALIMHRWEDGTYRIVAHANASPEFLKWLHDNPVTAGDGSAVGIVAAEKATLHLYDALADPRFTDLRRQKVSQARTMLAVPLLQNDDVIGIIFLARRVVAPFSARQVELVTTFADQAVIAIENARLVNELRQSLRQQTAVGDVLKTISRSTFDLQAVLDTLVQTAAHLCEADMAFILRREGELYRAGAAVGFSQAYIDFLRQNPVSPGRGTLTGRVALARKAVQILDVAADPDYTLSESTTLAGQRSALGVPLLRENELIGVIILARQRVQAFTPEQVELVTTFADQAVIAIENVRLFDEVQARTGDLTEALEQQTATSDVLATISSSAGDLTPIFQKMLENATRICGATFGTMTLYDQGSFETVALYNTPEPYSNAQLNQRIKPHPESGLSIIARTRNVVQIEDLRTQQPYIDGHPNVRALADLGGARTLLMVPMLKDRELIGTITIFRQEVKRFTEKQTSLVANFASQAVIAIDNARLLNELRQRTQELSQSLDELRAAQDRLVQTEKLASLGQLTAGIAHEIKNPLNFVTNFAALSAELADELDEQLTQVAVEDKLRDEIGDLTSLLKENLAKIVQHGRRADSIVKSMLMHSREGSREQRPADINALIDESLNLAYHGARAERPGFEIDLQRDFDPAAGTLDLFPQDAMRAFLNVISNGVYAASRRHSDGDATFAPSLLATTRNLGHSVEIRIRDNGAGIPADVKDKIFNPFFTTKPTGEGTGLGLSITHDIIVKQHGGRIEVASRLGEFTEFIITLPRGRGVREP